MACELPPELLPLLRDRRLVALTGAGCSTESGIPDYRGPDARPRTPIQGPAFERDPAVRRRYWARSMLGWPKMAASLPNDGHRAMATLERAGLLELLITQNVDGLHLDAGSEAVIELHGALRLVRCLSCGARSEREALQRRLEAENPQVLSSRGEARPDGDAELEDRWVADFTVPACEACDGVLKPDVVFFGDSVPAARVEAAYAAVDRAEVLLVAGSSLQVFSGFRFVKRAAAQGKPVVILNQGPTRGDPLAALKVEARLGALLPALAAALAAPTSAPCSP